MTPAPARELLTIGHSNLTADRFIGLLTNAGVTAVADVRSVPFSRRWPWFSQKPLAARLAVEGIAYVALGGPTRHPSNAENPRRESWATPTCKTCRTSFPPIRRPTTSPIGRFRPIE
jgi:hypothetical protein